MTTTTENRYVYRTVWEPLLDHEITSENIAGIWDIPEHFKKNLEKQTPYLIEMEDLIDHFRKSIRTLSANDQFLDGREYRLHPTANGNEDGTIFYYGQELNWWISLILQRDSSPDTILNFARSEYQNKIDSIRGIIYKIAAELSNNGYAITMSQFRQRFLREVRELNLGVIPNPFSESPNPLENFIATPAHFGFVLAEEPGFVFDHITQKLSYSGILGEIIPLPFGDEQPNTLDLFYHEVQMLIYNTVPDRFKAINAAQVNWNAVYDNIAIISLDDTNLIRNGVYRLPTGRFIRPLEKVVVKVNSVELVQNEDYQILLSLRDIAFNRYKIPVSTDIIEVTVYGYIDESIVPNPYIIQNGKAVFDIRNYVYTDIADKTLIRCYTPQDILDEEERRFYAWLKRNVSWKDRNINPFANEQNINDPFTWNYKDHDVVGMPVMWYEIYEQYFNTSGPQYEPWIVQGYDEKPSWWDIDFPPTITGLYPYIDMWNNIQNGIEQPSEIANPTSGFAIFTPTYTLPINTTTGDLLPPYYNGLIDSMFTVIPTNNFMDFVFGDNSPTEIQWRNSADYVWDYIDIGYHLKPIDFVSLCWDSDRMRVWRNGLVVDSAIGKMNNHTDMVFFGDYEDTIEKDVITYSYDYISDGYTNQFSGQSYEFTSIEEFDGNGLQINFGLEFPFEVGDTSLVEVNGAVLTYGVDYFFVDADSDDLYETIQFTNAPGAFSATTGSEWDSRPNSVLSISGIDSLNNKIIVDGNYTSQFPVDLIVSINDSTANDGNWKVTNSIYNGTDTIIEVIAPTVTHNILDILPATNEFVVTGDQTSDYIEHNRFFVTNSSLYDGRWVIQSSQFDGVNTKIKANTSYTLTLNSVDALTNTIVVDGNQLIHATAGTEVSLVTTAGRDTTWTIISSSYSVPLDETTIILDFPINAHAIVGVDLIDNEFIIAGYQLNVFPLKWNTVQIYASTGNDGLYNIINTYYDNDGNTVVRVSEPIISGVVDGNLIVDGTISPYNIVTGVSLIAEIDQRYIVNIDSANNTISVLDDWTSAFTTGKTLTIRDSSFNDGDWEILSSTFTGIVTEISVVPPRNIQNIIGVNTISQTFTVAGDQTTISQIGEIVYVDSSAGNDGTYTINAEFFNGTNTIYTVNELIPSAVANGTLSLLSEINGTIDGIAIIIDGIVDGRLESTVNGFIANEQFWKWDIVGWDDISLGISVPVRVRIGSPTTTMAFDEHDEINIYVNNQSYPNSNISYNTVTDVVTLLNPPSAFDVITIVVYNPRDIIEKDVLSSKLKLTTGLNQWYSQFYLYRGEQIYNDNAYADLWRKWSPSIVYRTNNIINPKSVIVQAYSDLVFRNEYDYNVELDSSTGIRDFYIDSFLVTVAQKTETSFDTDNKAPQSTIFQVDNFDPRRNFVKTAVSRKDSIFKFTRYPVDDNTLEGFDNIGNELRFRASDTISCIIGSTFYDVIVNVPEQTITLSQDVLDDILSGGTEVVILIEPITKQLTSHQSSDIRFNDVFLVDNLLTNSSTKSSLDSTNYILPLEFDIDANDELATQEVILPAQFTPQQFITFLAEYERYLLEVGGVFDELDGNTYRNYEALMKSFVEYVDLLEVYSETTYEERFVELNVMNSVVRIGTEFGQLGEIESQADYYSKKIQDLLDINGYVISTKSIQVIREDGLATISLIGNEQINVFFADNIPFTPDYISYVDPRESGTVFPTEGQIWFNETDLNFYSYVEISSEFVLASTVSSIEYVVLREPLSIYTGHFIIDKFESIIRFENNTSTGKSIYKPLTGEVISRLYVQFDKARIYNGRPIFGGFALVPNDTTGLLEPIRNIESQIQGIINLFDPFSVPLDDNFSKGIHDLLGLKTEDYLYRFLGAASPRSLIGFQQGFIQQKGASDNIEAFVQAMKSIISIDLYEAWAYKVAEYGDNSGDDYVIIKIKEKEGARGILGLHFTDASGSEVPDPGLVEVKENDIERFPQLLDAYTTKDGSRFYFPSIEEGSVSPEWERNWITNVLAEPNNYASHITATNEYGFDFGTYGLNGLDRVVRLASATLYQDIVDFANTITIQYYDESLEIWKTLAKNVQIQHNDEYNKPYDEIVFPYHNIKARRWKLVATDINAGPWNTTFEFHKYRAKPDYNRLGKISGYNNITDINVATWYPWDVLEGHHTPEAYQYIDHESEYDPAIYSFSTGNAGRIEQARAWGDDHVGEVWWDKNDWGVIDYKNVREFPTAIQRVSLWGKIAAGKKVSVYEWVKSPVHPTEWETYVKEYENSENSLSERIPSGVVKSITDYTVEVRTNKDGNAETFYYFWIKGSTIRSYTKNGVLRSLSLKQIGAGLEHPNNITTNKFYIIDNHLDESANWIVGADNLPPRFTKLFCNLANQVFTSDYVDLHINRKFLLSNNLQTHDFRSNRHEEWTLMHRGLKSKPNEALWNEIVEVLTNENAANAIDYDVNDPNKLFMPRDELIRLLNKRVIEIRPDFFPTGYESANVSGVSTYELDTPYDGAATIETFDLDSTDQYRRIRSLGDTNINYFSGTVEQLELLMSIESETSFYNVATPQEVNELFFDILEESLAFDIKKSNIFKTSWIAYNAVRLLVQTPTWDGTLKDLDLVLDFIETEAKPYHTQIHPDISSVVLAYNESVNIAIDDMVYPETNLRINEYIDVEVIDYFTPHIYTLNNENVDILIHDTVPIFADLSEHVDSAIVQFTDAISMNINMSLNDTLDVEFYETITHSLAIRDYPVFATDMDIEIIDAISTLEHFTTFDEFNIAFADNVDGVDFSVGPEYMNISIVESSIISAHDYKFNAADFIDINIAEIIVTDIFDRIISVGADYFDATIDETLRIDIEEYDSVKNWYYGWYMIHDGGENLDYIQGDDLNNPPDGIFVGLEPGLDEDPSSEDWYRWDGIKLDNVYYISSFDNFSFYDQELLGYDLEVIGRAGYNWDGVGNNLINSNSNSGKFLRARPIKEGLPTGNYQFTFTQVTASNTWIVLHGLGYTPIIRVYLSTGEEIIPTKVTTGNTSSVITFSSPVTGIARFI